MGGGDPQAGGIGTVQVQVGDGDITSGGGLGADAQGNPFMTEGEHAGAADARAFEGEARWELRPASSWQALSTT
jgi:hypothetical protein